MITTQLTLAACLVLAGNTLLLHTTQGAPVATKGATLLMEKTTRMTPAQTEWLGATPSERIGLSERLGEIGARNWARNQGWVPLLEDGKKAIPQGPDMVYRGANHTVHVIEAKGGSGQLSHAYGHPQGSAEWAVKSAQHVVACQTATEVEKSAAREVLSAAADGRLEVHVVRTPHILGQPSKPMLEQTVRCNETASTLARTARAEEAAFQSTSRAAAEAADSFRSAEAGSAGATRTARPPVQAGGNTGTVLKRVARGAAVAGIVVDAGLRVADAVEMERQYETGQITSDARIQAHARNAAGMAGGWGGAGLGGKLGAEGGATVGTFVCPGLGTIVGGVLGGIAGGIGGYFGGEWIAEQAADFITH